MTAPARVFMRFLLRLLTVLCGIDMFVSAAAYGQFPPGPTFVGIALLIALLFTSDRVRRFVQ